MTILMTKKFTEKAGKIKKFMTDEQRKYISSLKDPLPFIDEPKMTPEQVKAAMDFFKSGEVLKPTLQCGSTDFYLVHGKVK